MSTTYHLIVYFIGKNSTNTPLLPLRIEFLIMLKRQVIRHASSCFTNGVLLCVIVLEGPNPVIGIIIDKKTLFILHMCDGTENN